MARRPTLEGRLPPQTNPQDSSARRPTRVPSPERGPSAERDLEFDLDELREFLAADHVDVPVDPLFKKRLRRKLWSMVRRGRSAEPPVGV